MKSHFKKMIKVSVPYDYGWDGDCAHRGEERYRGVCNRLRNEKGVSADDIIPLGYLLGSGAAVELTAAEVCCEDHRILQCRWAR